MTVPLPPYAYVPGRTERHPEGHWDGVRATVTPGMDAHALATSDAFTAGMAFFEAGFYWEAHELWEAVWMACPPNSAEYRLVQALIQLANAELKLVMDQPRAAARLCGIAEDHLSEAVRAGQSLVLGVDLDGLQDKIADCDRRALQPPISAL